MQLFQPTRSDRFARALDLNSRAVQVLATFDSPASSGAALTDPILPPPELVSHLRVLGHTQPSVRFETLYGGRTNQVWKVLDETCSSVLKLYDTAFKNPLFRNDATLEAACLRALNEAGFAPKLRASGSFENAHWVLYDHAPGAPWRSQADSVAKLLRKLHGLSVNVDAPNGCNGSDDLARNGQSILDDCHSDFAEFLNARKPDIHVDPTKKLSLVHGDPVPGNILVDTTGLTLIDWQCPSFGDPCEDLALFLSPAMQHIYRGSPLSQSEIQRFLTAYEDTEITNRYLALQPWYAWRMAAYCLWRSENGAPDYAAGVELELATL